MVMNFKIFENEDTVANYVANILRKQMNDNPTSTIGLATGKTMVPIYKQLVDEIKEHPVDMSQLKFINVDEYVDLDPSNKESFAYFMKEKLYSQVNVLEHQSFIPTGSGEEAVKQFNEKLEEFGTPVLQLLGIGQNGHIGFNEPGTSFDEGVHVVNLSEETKSQNKDQFADGNVPTKAITMGIKDIMKSREIILVATGQHKANIIRELYDAKVSENFPASILKEHRMVTVVLDKEAASELPQDIQSYYYSLYS